MNYMKEFGATYHCRFNSLFAYIFEFLFWKFGKTSVSIFECGI